MIQLPRVGLKLFACLRKEPHQLGLLLLWCVWCVVCVCGVCTTTTKNVTDSQKIIRN